MCVKRNCPKSEKVADACLNPAADTHSDSHDKSKHIHICVYMTRYEQPQWDALKALLSPWRGVGEVRGAEGKELGGERSKWYTDAESSQGKPVGTIQTTPSWPELHGGMENGPSTVVTHGLRSLQNLSVSHHWPLLLFILTQKPVSFLINSCLFLMQLCQLVI